jgi:oxygen-dependent protoporphyrinogen oxidase
MVCIIGGGISGLAAAYELAKRRVPFTLFEATSRVGGLVRTERVDGFTIEAGADSILVQKRAGLELCEELGLTARLLTMKEPRTAYVLHRGRLHPLPSRSVFGIPSTWRDLARYSLLPATARVRLALEPLMPRRSDGGDESVASFFRRRFGAATVDVLAQPLLGGIHAGEVEALSIRALFPRLVSAEQSGPLLRWVRQLARTRLSGGAFRSIASGMGELVDAIVRRLPQDALRCDSPALALSRRENNWMVETPAGPHECAAVILACPAPAAGRLLASVDARASEICAQVPYVSTVSIALAWPRECVAHPLNGSGFVVARSSNGVRTTACTWVSSKWENRAPAGHVLLRAYLGGAHDAAAVDLSDDELTGITVRELSEILSISGSPEIGRVFRWRNSGAQHEVGHLARIGALDDRLAALPGLFVAGSGFRSIGIPDCVADGREAAVAAARLVA